MFLHVISNGWTHKMNSTLKYLFSSQIIRKDINKTVLTILKGRNLSKVYQRVNRPIYNRKFTAPFIIVANLREAGTFQRTEISEKHFNDQFHQIRLQYFPEDNNVDRLEVDKWTNFRQELLQKCRNINENNIDAIVINMCSHDGRLMLAKNYVEYLQNNCNLKLNDGAQGKLLRVYNAFYHQQGCREISQHLQEEIYIICDGIRKKYPLLDGSLCENLIVGLVPTKRWREGLELLEMAKITSNPTNLAYTELAIKAFLENDFELGWSLCESIVQLQVQPKCEIFLTYLENIATRNDQKYFQEGLGNLLEFLSKHTLIVSQKVVKLLDKIHQENPHWFGLKHTQLISKSIEGICANCNQKLQNVSLSDAEFQQLKETFNEKVLLGGDIFQKSTPQEVKAFFNYVRKTAPYDCVIDGLNVAYSVGRNYPNSLLATLVSGL